MRYRISGLLSFGVSGIGVTLESVLAVSICGKKIMSNLLLLLGQPTFAMNELTDGANLKKESSSTIKKIFGWGSTYYSAG